MKEEQCEERTENRQRNGGKPPRVSSVCLPQCQSVHLSVYLPLILISPARKVILATSRELDSGWGFSVGVGPGPGGSTAA